MREFYEKYQKYFPAAFFLGGFAVDLLTTDRIDQSFSLIQQAVYLLLIMIFVYWEVVTPTIFQKEGHFLQKVWKFHVEALHFLFGSLLSLYTIFYFKSASLMTSFVFMFFMAGLLIINELPQFQKQGMRIRSSLMALCLSSYFIYLVPVVSGEIGVISFILSMAVSLGFFLFVSVRVLRRIPDQTFIKKNFVLPGLLVQFAFVALYFAKVLPPVPISLKYIGIYHDIQKHEGRYVLNYERSWWRFWQSGAQTFVKRQGDKLYCFVSIFSPTQFKDKLHLAFYKKGKNGWRKHDTIPLDIKGGRSQGYRGYVYKSNFELGDWQVRVMTSDSREVGRISLDVVQAGSAPRQWRQELY